MTTPVKDATKDADAIIVYTKPGILRVQIWGERIARITYAPGEVLPPDKSFAIIARPADVKWEMEQDDDGIVARTGAMQVRVDRKSGAVAFADSTGATFAREAIGGRAISTSQIANKLVAGVAQEFSLADGEAIYGLGQHQDGVMNRVGSSAHLQQKNMEVAVPFAISSKGYGIFWDNPAVTDVDVAKSVPGIMRWSSEAGDAIDYYVILGPSMDDVIGGYRTLTGEAPMFPRWAWGMWQSRERYKTQEELLGIARDYRKRNIPIDGMVQDWQYWSPEVWGSHAFGKGYPDPKAMAKELHDLNFHWIISVWGKFDKGSKNYDELDKAGLLYPTVYQNVYPKGESRWYDAFNPAARAMYWKQMSEEIYSVGVDGWWLDATEPELGGKWGEMRDLKTGAGPGYKVFNAWPLMSTTAVHDGQLAQRPDRRVFILTRSAWAGQQRNGAVTWSGDIHARWDVFKKQIPAGLNFVSSGIPYWNTDIGAFFADRKAIDDAYRELFTRWFQFGAFCPMFRVHGTDFPKELWAFGPETERTLVKYDKLRYRLLPYIYSVSWKVTNEHSTMMRPLVMDFRDDSHALSVDDQFLFGPAIMVNPVTSAGATSRKVYLPGKIDWIDFDTGKKYSAGQTIDEPAPIESTPLFIRAGSILPLGTVVQSTAEKCDPIELRVYRGADGSFTLYEDDGETNEYQQGKFSTIPMTWNDAKQTLTIGERKGSFDKMPSEHEFHVVFVSEGHSGGGDETEKPDRVVKYSGKTIEMKPQ